jgi:hypothetical protein
MNTESEKFTANESLDIITRMIGQAQGNVQRSSFHFLLWGWVVVIANIGMFTLIQVDYDRPHLAWLICIPAWIASMVYGFKGSRNKRVITYIDRAIMWLWIGFGISVFTLVFFGYSIRYNLNPVIMLMTAVPTLVSGVIIKFKPLIMGGIFFWIMAIVCFLVEMEYHNLVGAVAVIGGYMIPGYLLKNKKD